MGARRLRATASRENGQALEKARRACQRWRRFGFGAPPDWGWGRAGLGSTEPCYTVNAIRARLIFRRRRPLGRPLGRFGLFRAPFGSSRMKIAATLASPGASRTALCRAVGPDDGMAAAVEPKDGQAGGARGLVVPLQKSRLDASMLVAVAQNAPPSIAGMASNIIDGAQAKSRRSASVHARLTL